MEATESGLTITKLRQTLPMLWPSDVACVAAGRSAALRIKVDRINHLLPFDEQSAKVNLALRAVQRHLDLSGSIPNATLALKEPASAVPGRPASP